MIRVFLASASPRRSQLLDQLHVAHEVRPVDLDESRFAAEPPAQYVRRLAAAKAQALWATLGIAERLPVLAADTTVALGDDIFGKPADRADGLRMLSALSGRTHEVFTAVALQTERGCEVRLSVSEVTFGMLSERDCAAYWDTGEPGGKAGGYAVQGLAAAFITRISGSYSGIMGLPLAETAELVRLVGWSFSANERTHGQMSKGELAK